MDTMASTATVQTDQIPTVRRGPVSVDYLRTHPTVSVEQAAGLLGISRAYGYDMVRRGELPTITLGGRRYRVKSSALLRMLGETSDLGG
jgi:excisionase family DNA binding protein